MLTTIAVDAMGGDNAPAIEVEGAIQAARELRARILLVGQEERIRAELERQGVPNPRKQRLHIEIVNATEVITMMTPWRNQYAANAIRPFASPRGWCARARRMDWSARATPAR